MRAGMTLAHARALLPSAGGRAVGEETRAGACSTCLPTAASMPQLPVEIASHQLEQDAIALRKLAVWMVRFAPRVVDDPPDGLLLDISGCARLYGGEERIVDIVGDALVRLGLRARLAIASSIGCAWAGARYGIRRAGEAAPGPQRPERLCRIVPPGGQRAALDDLPIAALRCDPATQTALAQVGVFQIGQLWPIPRAQLGARFGRALLERIDQALGTVTELMEPVRPIEPLMIERQFDGPVVHLEAIAHVSRELVYELAARLEKSQRGVRLLTLELRRARVEPLRISVRFTRPRAQAGRMWQLLEGRLERALQGARGVGVESLALLAERCERLASSDSGLWNEARADARGMLSVAGEHAPTSPRASSPTAWPPTDAAALPARPLPPPDVSADPGLAEFIDTLVNQLGPDAVCELTVSESHVPERVFSRRPALESALPGAIRNPTSKALTRHARPTVLLDPPEPARVMYLTPDGPLLALTWRGRQSKLFSCLGPEHISLEWWRDGPGDDQSSAADESIRGEAPGAADPATSGAGSDFPPPARAYFTVQDEHGRWLWIFHQLGEARWFVHGEWA